MSWLLFIDESGQDLQKSPYEVLAGVAVEDRVLWRLIRQITNSQIRHFGHARYRDFEDEAKARKLLKRKTFRLAEQGEPIPPDERRELAHQALQDGGNATQSQLTALGQAKIAYCHHILELAHVHGCVAFASIIPGNAGRPEGDFLRKDYAYLFERFYHFLNSRNDKPMGIVVFDELEKSKSHILVNPMHEYFVRTNNGRFRSGLVIPEPLFVHSDLTTMIQIADIVAYVISWGVRLRNMVEPRRKELQSFAEEVLRLRYRHEAPGGHTMWGFKLIPTLEPSSLN